MDTIEKDLRKIITKRNKHIKILKKQVEQLKK